MKTFDKLKKFMQEKQDDRKTMKQRIEPEHLYFENGIKTPINKVRLDAMGVLILNSKIKLMQKKHENFSNKKIRKKIEKDLIVDVVCARIILEEKYGEEYNPVVTLEHLNTNIQRLYRNPATTESRYQYPIDETLDRLLPLENNYEKEM